MSDLIKTEAFDPEQYVTVGRIEDPVEAQLAKGMLEAAGIECFLQGENANHMLNAAFRVRLLVHRKDESAARELLPAPGAEDETSEGLEDGE